MVTIKDVAADAGVSVGTCLLYTSLLSSLETAAYQNGYKLLLFNSRERDEKEDEYMEMCKASRVAGIILCSGSVETERFRDLNVPLVTIERFLEYGTSAVECDNRQGGRLAAQHLLECGCTNVIYRSGENAVSYTHLYLIYHPKSSLPIK